MFAGRSVAVLLALSIPLGAIAAEATTTPLTDAQIEIVRSALEERLLDAQSARFRNVVFGDSLRSGPVDGMKTLCGKVNAKNRMGAYTGYVTFFGSWIEGGGLKGDAPLAYILGVDSEERSSSALMCADDLGYR